MEIGKFIKEAREKKGYSQEDLSKLCGISSTQVLFIETGRSLKPQKRTLSAIAKVLKLNEEELFLMAGHKKKEGLPDEQILGVDLKKIIQDTVSETIKKISIAKGEVGVLRPLVRLAKCGGPSEIAYSDEQVRVSTEYAESTDFVVETEGDSMKEYNIPDKSRVYIKKQSICNTGDIVLICNYDEPENPRLCIKKAREVPGIGILFMNGSGDTVSLGEKIEIIGVVKHIIISL